MGSTQTTSITRKFGFDAGHRVLNHEGKCRYLHGHRYTAEVGIQLVEEEGLDNLGRVIDFGVVKTLVGNWIDENWDHNLILNRNDPLLEVPGLVQVNGRLPYLMPEGQNPTAELMARELFRVVNDLLRVNSLTDALEVDSIRVWETPNCYADYTSDWFNYDEG